MAIRRFTLDELHEHIAVLNGKRDYTTNIGRAYAAAIMFAHEYGDRKFVRLVQQLQWRFDIDKQTAKDTAARMRQLRLAFLNGQYWHIKLTGELARALKEWTENEPQSVMRSRKEMPAGLLEMVAALPHSRPELLKFRRPYERAWAAAALLAVEHNRDSFRGLRPKIEAFFNVSTATVQVICGEMRELGLIAEQGPNSRLWRITFPFDPACDD